MTLTFDPNAYRNLLTEVVPMAIDTESEYERILQLVEKPTFKKNRTIEEQALYKLLIILIETYEIRNEAKSSSRLRPIFGNSAKSSHCCLILFLSCLAAVRLLLAIKRLICFKSSLAMAEKLHLLITLPNKPAVVRLLSVEGQLQVPQILILHRLILRVR